MDRGGNAPPGSRSLRPGCCARPDTRRPVNERPAQRQVLLAGSAVSYELQRARRRSIGLTVSAQGLVVRAPAWTTLGTIEAALQEKSVWVLRKLQQMQEQAQRQQAARIVWAEGGQLPWQGGVLTLRCDGLRRAPLLSGEQLHTGLPPGSPTSVLRARVLAWFQREARAHFAQQVQRFAPRLQVQPARVLLTSAATRWGSASAQGSIRLNWRLMHLRPELIDYVVVHELAHLREMNHSPRFWAIVEQLVPQHRQLRRELRGVCTPLWD
ncbi:M48 family metallopeptidase [Comamonas sp. NLF-1-9]|nr:M48 family metallopeptidase [Comamonas sp. NLF-1-9]